MLGSLEVIVGPMFSGKSEELIRRLSRREIAGDMLHVFKPYIDLRTSDEIVSRSGYRMKAIVLTDKTLFQEWRGYPVSMKKMGVKTVGVDEAQFFDKSIVSFVRSTQEQGINIIVSGLDTDFARQPFGMMPYLLAMATDVTKLTAICHNCGADAHYTYRKSNDKEQIIVGDTDIYEAACGECYGR